MSTEIKNDKKNKTLEVILYYAAAMALPNIFLFNIYTQNRENAQIIFGHVLILAVIMAIVSAIGLLIIRFLTRTYEGSLLIMLPFWVLFWFFESLSARLPINSKAVFLVIIFIVLICFIGLFRFLSDKFQKGRMIFSAIAGVITLLFVFNAFPTFVTALTISSAEIDREVTEVTIRRSFDVDASLQNPDIYWLHMDGMISIHSMEHLLNAPQDELRERLLDLGFVINEDAQFIAHDTVFGVPGLLSPDFYDSFLHEHFMEGSHLLRRGRSSLLNDAVDREGILFAEDVAPYHELFHAFLQAGYTGVMIADFDLNVYVPIDHFYRLGGSARIDDFPFTTVETATEQSHFLQDALDLVELLTLMTPLPYRLVIQIREGRFDWKPIPSHDEAVNHLTENTRNFLHERQLYRRLIDSFSLSEPKLLYLTAMFTHGNRWHWKDSELSEHGAGAGRLDLYPLAHEYGVKVMFNMIDMILERNPNAIIVIQADHGMHLHATQRQLLAEGFTEEEVAHLQNSVISAVRIPEQYGGLDEPLDPRNITRELVNRFVGENYELLPR